MSKRTFEYGGYNFFPVRKLEGAESGFYAISKRISIDAELGLCEEGYAYPSKFPYFYDDFYKAAGGHEYDLFRCVENGKIYIPCHHDLQIYREEKNKTFEVTITETLSRTVRVEAEDAYEAQTIVNDGY
ncbi:MAG: DpnD/PcfM family protein, partial [Clostridia bacterium]|nr:DpnD/PcfM family protein [Clostridia bacterium]